MIHVMQVLGILVRDMHPAGWFHVIYCTIKYILILKYCDIVQNYISYYFTTHLLWYRRNRRLCVSRDRSIFFQVHRPLRRLNPIDNRSPEHQMRIQIRSLRWKPFPEYECPRNRRSKAQDHVYPIQPASYLHDYINSCTFHDLNSNVNFLI